MSLVQKEIRFGKSHYPVVFGSNALRLLEKETGTTIERLGLLMVTGRAGYSVMQAVVWAGLEHGRLRNRLTRPPFTMEEVGDLLDEEGGSAVIWAPEDDGFEEQEEEREEVINGETVKTTVKTRVQVREPRDRHPIAVNILECWASAFPQQQRKEPEPANPQPAAAD